MKTSIRGCRQGPSATLGLALFGAILSLSCGLVSHAAQTSPLEAKLVFENPPPRAVFPLGAPIMMRLQIRNVTSAPVYTTDGFSRKDFPRHLVFTAPNGMMFGTNSGTALRQDIQPAYCFYRQGVLQRPTSLPVVPLEVLPPDFGYAREYKFDARHYYDLRRPGLYSAQLQLPLLTFDESDPNAVIKDCDDLPGILAYVGHPMGTQPVPNRVAHTVRSPRLQFVITLFNFGGFTGPLKDDGSCTSFPCKTFNLGRTLPVKFQLFDSNNAVVTAAAPRIAVHQVGVDEPLNPPEDLGKGAADAGNVFRYDTMEQQYIFQLDTKVLSKGTWRIDALLDDGTTQSVYVGLR